MKDLKYTVLTINDGIHHTIDDIKVTGQDLVNNDIVIKVKIRNTYSLEYEAISRLFIRLRKQYANLNDYDRLDNNDLFNVIDNLNNVLTYLDTELYS